VAAIASGLQPGWDAGALKTALLDGADRIPALAGRGVTDGRLSAAGTAALAAGRPPGAPDRRAFLPSPASPGEAPAGTPPARAAAPPRVRRLRVKGRPRICRGVTGCRARTATLQFSLTGAATVTAQLERRRPGRWVRAGRRTRAAQAGITRWIVGPRLLGMRLRPGRWRVAVTAPGGTARRAFHVGPR